MFTCLTVTLQKTVGKWHFALILCFLVENRGSQAGVHPISTLRVSMGIPLLSTPIFNSENTKLLLNVVFPLFSVTVTVKQVNKELIPIGSFTLLLSKKLSNINSWSETDIKIWNNIINGLWKTKKMATSTLRLKDILQFRYEHPLKCKKS